VRHRGHQHRDRLPEVERGRRAGEHLRPVADVRLQVAAPALRHRPVQRPRVRGHHRVIVHVDDPRFPRRLLGHLVRIAGRAALWAALSAAPAEGISVPELVTASDMSRRWVYYRLRELAAAGRVVQTARQACVCTTRDQQYQEAPKVAHIGSIIVVRAYD
jgi:hypothetical protein